MHSQPCEIRCCKSLTEIHQINPFTLPKGATLRHSRPAVWKKAFQKGKIIHLQSQSTWLVAQSSRNKSQVLGLAKWEIPLTRGISQLIKLSRWKVQTSCSLKAMFTTSKGLWRRAQRQSLVLHPHSKGTVDVHSLVRRLERGCKRLTFWH